MLRPVSSHAAEALDAALAERIQAHRPRQPLTGLGGMQRAADLINLAGLPEAEALRALADVDPEAAELLSQALFTFADLARVDARGLQTVMRSIEADLLVPALRAAPEALREQLLAAMPQRAADVLRDEMSSRGPVRMDEAEEAQRSIAAVARKLALDGEIILPGQGPGFV
jgi:flagellar motor switch protein FliG